MVEKTLVLGAHMSVAGGVENALWAAKKYRCQCVQMFVVNQRQWRRPVLTDEQIQRFRETRQQTKISPVVVHASYLINLAAADRDTYQKSLMAIIDELRRCETLGADYYVLHPGSHMGLGEEKGLKKIIASVNKVFHKIDDGNCKLLLETTAGQGTSLGCRFEQLAYIIEQAEASDRLGVCIDTSHIFAAGYDFREPETFKQMLRQFDDILGLERLQVIHVNDSKTGLGSGVDRHEHIGKGKIGREGFRNFLTDRRTRYLPFILETPKGKSPGGRDLDKLNLNALRRWARV
jgi:deoxyribonuclease-4